MRKKFKPSDLLIGIIFTLFFIALGLMITINLRPLYYFDVQYLNLEEKSGFDRETILTNYNALIDYCSPFFNGALRFSSMALSSRGLQHFQEVKFIFNQLFLFGLISLAVIIVVVIYKNKKRDHSYLFVSSITSVLLPAAVGIACAVNFDKTFLLFHKIFFRNDYWLFDWNQDQVIRILPSIYFLQCAMLIILVMMAGSLSLLYFSRKLKRNKIHYHY